MDMKNGPTAAPASPAPSLQKPRLVAKTGTNSRAAALSNSGSSGAPDASKVWNRNRPAPPPQPKQFTDEELKQQYGIHLATRLQADEPGKGSTWADMEDDEDDWAPETVEWMDGTKSTLQPTEEQKMERSAGLTMAEEQEKAAIQDEQEPPEPSEQDQSAPSIGPGKTILRPGARASGVQTTRPGLVLKSVPEPTTDLPKQTTPGPAKSPWATLPPVDKVSPVSFNPPAHEVKPPPVSYRDYKPPPLPSEPSPAREIAADTFERSWRENDRGSRELFDSKSGRYEPVRDKRRSSFRGEGSFRPPSVLQRPSHGQPSDSADPVSSHRMQFSQDARQWGRRRSSVAVEDGSEPRNELPHSPQSAAISLSDHAPPSVTSSAAPQAYSAHGPDAGPPHGAPPTPGQNMHEMQGQLMRQKIEANRRRKEEEQAKEEAAKQERIRQRLLALGEPPKRQDTTAPEQDTATVPSETDRKPSPEKFGSLAQSTEMGRAEPILRPPPSAPLGPATHLDGLGEVPVAKKPSSIAAPETASKTLVTPQLPGSRLNPSPLQPSAAVKSNSEPSEIPHPSLGPSKLLPESHRPFDRPQQQWNRANGPIGSGPGWSSNASNAAAKASANVWGPPSKDKTLGNGAFDSDMARLPSINFPSQPAQQSNQPPPGPIAPPTASPKAHIQAGRSAEPSPPGTLPQTRLDWQGQPPGFGQRPGFSGPMDQRHPGSQPFFHQAQPPIGAQWNAPGPRDRHLFEDDRRHTPIESTLPLRARPLHGDVVGDRWNQRSMPLPDGLGPVLGTQPAPQNLAPGAPVGGAVRSSSRFFGVAPERPVAAHHSIPPASLVAPQATQSQTGGTDADLFGNDMSSFTHGRAEPLVKLPKPKPKVKLPSAPVSRTPELERAGPAFASRSQAYGTSNATPVGMRGPLVRFGGQQPIVANAEWQNRFDMVTGRKSSAVSAAPQSPRGPVPMPSRPQPVGVSTSTRPLIDMSSSTDGATVSLPQQTKTKDPALYTVSGHLPLTKPGDECLYDEPENGSQPVVLIPSSLISSALASTVMSGQNKMLTAARPAAILAGAESEFRFEVSAKIMINILGMTAPTFKWLSRKSTYSYARGGKGPRKPFQKKDRPFERNENRPFAAKESGDIQKRGSRPTKDSATDGESSSREKKPQWAKPPRSNNKPSAPKVEASTSIP